MALVNQTLKLEITPGWVPPILHVTEYDENMQVEAQLFQRGQAFTIPSGVTAKVEGTLAGHPFSADATVDGSNVTFELTKGMTAYAGRAWTKIKLTKDSKPVSTCGFWLECDRAGVEAETVIDAPGFEEQIQDAVDNYLVENPIPVDQEQIKEAVDSWFDDHGGVSVTVDDALSTTSENPVQNKVVKAALDAKADASDIPQNVRLDVVQMTTSDIQPLFVDVLAGNWLGSQNAAYSNSAENAEKYFTFSGNSGEDTVTVTGGTASISALTTNQWWRGVVEYDDGHCVPTMVSYQGTADTLSIYPPLDSSVTSGKIMPMMWSIHATSIGYKWYSQFVYSQNAKHCVKSKPIARYRAWNSDANPLSKINSFWWGSTTGNVQRNLQCTNNTLKFLYMNIGTGASVETPKGYSWTVNTGGKIGYAEICLSGTDGVSFFEYPSGEGIFVELYEDGTLAQSYHKTTVHFERVCLDFSECENVMVKVYVTGNSVNHSMNLMEISFWETGNYRTELLPFGSIPAQMFDSWGAQFDGATATEFKRLHSRKLGVTAPWENHSQGGATSAWGRAWFYENVVKNHPTHVLIDFIINDSNSRGAQNFAQTVAGPDGTLYDNVMDTVDEYIANMNAIIRMSIAAGIQPIICLAPYAENEKPDWSVKLIDAWASQGA